MDETKTCRKCGDAKGVGAFYKNRLTKDGRASWCIDCEKARDRRGYTRAYRQTTAYRNAREKYRSSRRFVEANREYLRRERQFNPLVTRARDAVKHAKKSGRLEVPAECERCGEERSGLHAHHHDYTKPLEVAFVCPPCHAVMDDECRRGSVLAIDPGNSESGWLVMTKDQQVRMRGIVPNEQLAVMLSERHVQANTLAIEMVASYGLPVGKDVFETCVWIGRFQEAWRAPEDVHLVYRKDVKMHLCGTPRAKDANIRQALIDRFPRTGGGKVPQVGTKTQPGPLYGMKSHLWAALGVAVTWWDANVEQPELTTKG